MSELKERSQIAVEDTWNLESVYATDALWEADFESIQADVDAFEKNKGRIASDIGNLKDVIVSLYELARRLDKLYVYASMRSDQDTGNTFYQAMRSRAQSLYVRFSAASAFFEPEILSHSEETVLSAIDAQEGLEPYRRVLTEILRRSAHTLDDRTEALLAQAENMAGVPRNVFSVFTNADLTYPDAVLSDGTRVPVANSNFISHLESENRELREAVFKTYYKQLGSFRNAIAGMLEGNVKQASFYAKARNYSSNRASYLSGSHIPEEVYDNLIEAVHQALPAMYRYVAIRKKILGVDELHMYDVYTPLFEAGGKKYPIGEAKKIVKEGLKPMGEEYLSILQEGFDNRWIDVYPNRGKRGGAYSSGCFDTIPFVLLNYQETLDNVFTLAHEMGHSIHSYYSHKNQPFQTADYRIFVAEVASTCNEALLIHDMLQKTTDKAERAYLLNHYLDTFKGTLFRQTMFAEFEHKIHQMNEKGIPLTADALCKLYLELNQLYFGPDMVSDEEISCEWMRIPHFYTPFYVYQYATGFSAATALSSRILREGMTAVEEYKKFLKGGGSMDPIDLLKMAGVDMTTKKPVADALALFEQLVGELEELV
ncbi:MAG: oligoendopeptidase F [Lachnospiraceae bacterium]|nr:oligoendopeptidase F [Lachnospiraceae bacterium]